MALVAESELTQAFPAVTPMMLPATEVAFAGGQAVAAMIVNCMPEHSQVQMQQQQLQVPPHLQQQQMPQQIPQRMLYPMPQQMLQQQQLMMFVPVLVPMGEQRHMQQREQQPQGYPPLGGDSPVSPAHTDGSSFSGSVNAVYLRSKPRCESNFSEGDASTCPSGASWDMHEEASSASADRIAVVSKCFTVVQRKNIEEIQEHCLSTASDDVELSMPDLGIELWGVEAMSGFLEKLLASIPDIELDVHAIKEDEPSSVTADFTMTGTQSQPLLPIFPMGRWVRWHCNMQVDFDVSGKIQRRSVSFNPIAELPHQTSFDISANLEGLSQCSLALASTPSGSRLLQSAMEITYINDDARVLLIEQLRGHIWEAAASPHGNHVLQKFIASVPPQYAQFIINELLGRAAEAAEHQKRCRVLERLLEHCPGSMTAGLVEQLLPRASRLARHPFGNFVLQHVLEHGTERHRHRLVTILCEDAGRLARHKIASNVVRAALLHAGPHGKAEMVQALAPDHQELMHLSKHKIGSFVCREIKLLSKQRLA